MRIAVRLLVCLAVFVALAPPGRAQEEVRPAQSQEQKSIPLADILKVGRDTPDLLRQIDVELRRNYLKEGDVSCGAAPLGMGGRGGAPYLCQFGDRTLRIEADRTFFDGRGKRLSRSGESDDTTQFDKAKSFRENNLRWNWTPALPR
jgi:hypothetical protein